MKYKVCGRVHILGHMKGQKMTLRLKIKKTTYLSIVSLIFHLDLTNLSILIASLRFGTFVDWACVTSIFRPIRILPSNNLTRVLISLKGFFGILNQSTLLNLVFPQQQLHRIILRLFFLQYMLNAEHIRRT